MNKNPLFCINRTVLRISLIAGLVLIASVVLAQTSKPARLPDKLIVAGLGQEYWIAITGQHGENRVTSIRQRVDSVTGRWSEVARFQNEVVSIAPLNNRLAVLLSGEEWRLVSSGTGPLGKSLPSPYEVIEFFPAEDGLLAVANPINSLSTPATTQTADAAPEAPLKNSIFRLQDNNWSKIASVPESLQSASVQLLNLHDKMFAAALVGAAVEVWVRQDEKWEKFADYPVTEVRTIRLLSAAGEPVLGMQKQSGVWALVHLMGRNSDVLTFETPPASDLAIVGTTLRVVYLKDNRVEQRAYDNYGRGDAYPIATIGDLSIPGQTTHSVVQLIGLVLLTLTMVLTFRQRPAMPNEMLARAKICVAPLGRRIASGVVDAIPLFVGMGYMIRHAPDLQLGVGVASAVTFVPSLIGLGIYLVHVTVAEMIWGRSFGKFLFGLRVLNYDGTRVAAERIFLRNMLRVVDLMFYAPLLLIVLTPMRQRVGDLAARTIVVAEQDDTESPSDPSNDE